MKAMRMGLGSALLLAALAGCRGEIPIVGYDAEGKVIETMIPKRKYVAQLGDSVNRLSESVVPIADGEAYGRKLSGLRRVRLGLGLAGSVGIGDYWKLGGNVAFALQFTNK